MPDVPVEADSLGPVALAFESRGLALRFAKRWDSTHAAAPLPSAESAWPALQRFVEGEGFHPRADSLELERPHLVASARRELARRRGGDAAAARVTLETDPDFRLAARVLRGARRPADVFGAALASARASGAGPASSPARPGAPGAAPRAAAPHAAPVRKPHSGS